MDNLFNLQELNLSRNQISRVKGLQSLKNLEILNLSRNQISCVEGLDKLVNLTGLDLAHNSFNPHNHKEVYKLEQMKKKGINVIY